MRKRRAFTLIELIVVMAITAILLTIITVPVIQSFNLTRAAQGFANAQAKARLIVDELETEMGRAAGVRDNSGVRGAIDLPVRGVDGTEVIVRVPRSKIDLVMPLEGDPRSRVGSAYIDPDTGKVDPTLVAPKGQASLPAVPGNTIVRYFIALRDPSSEYVNAYGGYRLPSGNLWYIAEGQQDNLFVLYRAEVQPYVYRDIGGGNVQRVVNTDFFVDGDRDNDPATSGIVMDDPGFMVWNDAGDPAIYPAPRAYDPAGKNEMIQNWLSQSTIVTENARYDMVMPKYNRSTKEMEVVGNVPQLVSLIRFQPSRQAQETARARVAVAPGQETENSVIIGADVFETAMKSWSNASLSIWPSNGPGGTGPLGNSAGREVGSATSFGNPIVTGVNATGGSSLFQGGTEVFNISGYLAAKNAGAAYPFTNAVQWGNLSPALAGEFIPVVPDSATGKLVASFSIQEVGTDVAIPLDERVPSTGTDPGIDTGAPITPAGGLAGAWHTYTGINERYAALFNTWDSLWPDPALRPSKDSAAGPKRFIDLRVTPQADGTLSPLNPSLGLDRGQIVPGSVELYGPDQTAGPNYGRLVRYSEVPSVDGVTVGPNQFKINYAYKANEPDWSFYGFGGVNYSPGAYSSTDFVSSVLQARFRPGYIELNSRYGEPIPQGNIYVLYRFQFTDSKTIVSVDYDSAELMDVVLAIRNYTQSNLPEPQMMTVRGSAQVRNLVR